MYNRGFTISGAKKELASQLIKIKTVHEGGAGVSKKEEQIGKLVEIHPCYINHHVNPISEDLITINKYNIDVFEFMLSKGLIENNRKSFGAISKIYVNYLIENYWNTSKFSFNPKISKLGKWILEKSLKVAEKKGVCVSRPSSYVKHKDDLVDTIKELFDTNPDSYLILKPHAGTRCIGIHLLCKQNCHKKLKEISKGKEKFYVLQEYIVDTHMYKNRKIDMRIYVGCFLGLH